MFMQYYEGGVSHVGAGPNPECDDGWMDEEGEDMELQPKLTVGSRDDVDDECKEEEWSEFEEEEDLGPEDGEADDEVEENYADL